MLKPNKVLVIYGPRQVGKTTLLEDYLSAVPVKHRLDSGEDVRIQEVLESRDFRAIKEYAAGYELLAIDEAQKVRGIGEALKILVDQVPGIRNALIANFNPPALRNDLGQLWENFLLMERIKTQAYRALPANRYFWRTWQGQEIDLIEEREGRLFAYELKWTGHGLRPGNSGKPIPKPRSGPSTGRTTSRS